MKVAIISHNTFIQIEDNYDRQKTIDEILPNNIQWDTRPTVLK